MGIPHLTSTRTVHIHNMFSLKVSVVVCWLAMEGLEAKPAPAMPVGSFSFSSQLGSNSIDEQQPALTTRTTSRGRVVSDDYTSYLPVEDTPEVQDANEKFLDAFQQQLELINEVREDGLWSVQPYADNYEYFEEAAEGAAEGDDEEDDDDDSSSSEEDSDEEDDDDEDEDDEDEDDEDEEDEDEDEEDEEDEDEEGDDSSSSEEGDSSSSEEGDDSSSSSSSEEDYGD